MPPLLHRTAVPMLSQLVHLVLPADIAARLVEWGVIACCCVPHELWCPPLC